MAIPTMVITAAEGSTPLVTNDGATTTLALTFTSDYTTSDFVEADLVLVNGALSSFAGSGTTYTATFTPTDEGRCIIWLPIGTFSNAGNLNTAPAAFQWDYDAPVLRGSQFEGNFPLTDPDSRPPIVLKGAQFEGSFPLTGDDRPPIVLRGIQFEGNFPAPAGGGLEVIWSIS
jgi:hypothetical protein